MMGWKEAPPEDAEPIPMHEWGCLALGAVALLVGLAGAFLT